MTEIVLFHHALGLTKGVRAFADDLRAAGHAVHTPDLFEGKTFATIDDGIAYARRVGFATVAQRGLDAAKALPSEVVYAGMSLGVVPAQELAQTRAGAQGALFLYSCLPVKEFGEWPRGLPAQVHIMEADPFALEGDLDAARELAAAVDTVKLFTYTGDRHLFAERGFGDYDATAAGKVIERALEFLAAIPAPTPPSR